MIEETGLRLHMTMALHLLDPFLDQVALETDAYLSEHAALLPLQGLTWSG
jgi:hypothetical protein